MNGEWTFVWAAYLVTWTALLGYRLYLRARAAEFEDSDVRGGRTGPITDDENLRETRP